MDDINSLVKEQNERFLDEAQLSKTFELFWSELEEKLDVIVRKRQPREVKQDRSDRDILEEILAIVRTQERGRQQEKDRGVLESSEVLKRMRENLKRMREEEIVIIPEDLKRESGKYVIPKIPTSPKIIQKSKEKRRSESVDSESYIR